MLTLLSDHPVANDPRLKICWIEDQLAEVNATIQQYFIIWRARRPDELADGLKREYYVVQDKIGRSIAYDLTCFPFDGYLADFNLSGAGLDVRSRSGDSPPPEPSPGEVRNYLSEVLLANESPYDDRADLACKAQAAGLTSAVLTALHFESHPSVILPYTAYTDQMSQQRALIRLLAPPTLIIGHGAELDLSKRPLGEKLEQFANAYRENLPVWAKIGVIHVPYREKQRLRALVMSRVERTEPQEIVRWQKQDSIIIDTAYGRRSISMGSLWFRFNDDFSSSSLSDVTSWIDKFPIPSAVCSEALYLARQYWDFSASDTSRERYLFSRIIRKLIQLKDSKPNSYHELYEKLKAPLLTGCSKFGIDVEQALSDPKAVTVRHYTVDHLLSLNISEDVKRLSVFLLLTMQYVARFDARADIDAAIPHLQQLLGQLSDFLREEWYGRANIDKVKGEYIIYDTLEKHGVGNFCLDEEDPRALITPIKDSDIVQRIDPLPKQLLTADDDFAGGRIGKALDRMGIKLQELITGRGNGGLRPEERRALQDFALDIEYPPEHWPEWLRHGAFGTRSL
jgi:hypothetical protein